MAVNITPYTDTDKIRARLGVDVADIDDDTVVAFQLDLQFALRTAELTIDPVAIQSAYNNTPADPVALKRWNLLQLYAASFCAATIARGRDLLFPMLFKDGKAETRRFSKVSLAAITDALDAETKKWEEALLGALDIVFTAASPLIPVAVVAPDVDPVTLEGA